MGLKTGFSAHDYKELHGAVGDDVLNVSGGDQTPTNPVRGFHANSDGNLVCRLVGSTTDQTYAMKAGVQYGMVISVIRQAGTNVTGNILY